MPHYVGLDVSQKTTSICVVDGRGRASAAALLASVRDAFLLRPPMYFLSGVDSCLDNAERVA